MMFHIGYKLVRYLEFVLGFRIIIP